ncbi:MAG: CoA transferase, partial [Burkholderiales bacterium]
GDPGLAAHPNYANADLRSTHRAALNQAISAHTQRYSAKELIALLNKAGVPCGPIYKMDEVFADPQVRHLGMAVPVPTPEGGEISLVAPAVKLSRTPAKMKRAMGSAGEHNNEVLRELGYSDSEITALATGKVI